ncbi:MAG: Na/Pi symporter [Pirellulales bacterium]
MLTLLTIAGGVALIVFAIRFLRKGLDRIFGSRLGAWLQGLSGNRLKAFFSGIVVSVLTPSSTTISVLAVQVLQAGHLAGRQLLALILGADIGLTVTVLLISLRLERYAMVLVLIGVVLFQFTGSSRSRGTGQLILSLGLIFTAIGVIKTAAATVSSNHDLNTIIDIAAGYPLALPCWRRSSPSVCNPAPLLWGW